MQNNYRIYEFKDEHRCKYHDGDGSFNLIDNFYEHMTQKIQKIQSYKKYKHTYVINSKRYTKQSILDILDAYRIFGSLIHIVKITYPDNNNYYMISNVPIIIDGVEKLLNFALTIGRNNTEVERPYYTIKTEDVKFLEHIKHILSVGTSVLDYNEIKNIIIILYNVVMAI